MQNWTFDPIIDSQSERIYEAKSCNLVSEVNLDYENEHQAGKACFICLQERNNIGALLKFRINYHVEFLARKIWSDQDIFDDARQQIQMFLIYDYSRGWNEDYSVWNGYDYVPQSHDYSFEAESDQAVKNERIFIYIYERF